MVSGTDRTAAGTACTGLSPPAVLADRPHCLRRLTARQDRFTLGLWLGECIIILMCRSSPRACHSSLCVKGPLPLFLLSRRDHGLSLSHGFSLSGCTSNVSAVASSHERIAHSAPMPTGGNIERSYRERRQDAAFLPPIPQSRRYAASISINCVLVGARINGAPVMRSRKLWSGYFQQVWINVRKLRSTQLLDVLNFCAVSR